MYTYILLFYFNILVYSVLLLLPLCWYCHFYFIYQVCFYFCYLHIVLGIEHIWVMLSEYSVAELYSQPSREKLNLTPPTTQTFWNLEDT